MGIKGRSYGGRAHTRVLAAAALCWLGVSGLRAEPLTVVGFNVDSGDASDQVIALQMTESRGVDIWGLGDIWPDGGWVEKMHEAAQAAEQLEYGVLVGETGGAARLMLLYRSDRLELLDSEELLAARGGKREAAPLIAHLRLAGAEEFLVLLVQLADGAKRRATQTAALADWASGQTLPVVALGTFSFGLNEGEGPDEEMQRFLAASGWRWLRPAQDRDTTCNRGGQIDDFVLIGGAATGWNGRAEVMFPQSNYCPDDSRTSSHRPVQARFATGGGAHAAGTGMAERQVLPLLPGDVQRATDEEADEEIDRLRQRVEELEARESLRQGSAAAGSAAPPADTSLPAAGSGTAMQAGAGADPAPGASVAAPTSAAGPRPAVSTASTPATAAEGSQSAAQATDQEALRRRLEALEREVQELRRLLEESSE